MEGLNLRDCPPPEPERAILQCAPKTADLRKVKPRPPSGLGRVIDRGSGVVWNAAMRSTGIASTIGVLASHLKALVARPDSHMGERHAAALAAVGAEEFQGALETSPGLAFAQEVMDVADHIFHLAMDATSESAMVAVTTTQNRRAHCGWTPWGWT